MYDDEDDEEEDEGDYNYDLLDNEVQHHAASKRVSPRPKFYKRSSKGDGANYRSLMQRPSKLMRKQLGHRVSNQVPKRS